MNKSKFVVRDLVEIAMLVALAIVLDMDGLKIRVHLTGGSIGFTMVPLFILALRHGPIKGFIGIGLAYGMITCILDGYGIATYPFDYLIAYGSICLAGLFRKFIYLQRFDSKKHYVFSITFYIAAIVLCCFTRFIGHTLSSLIIYGYDIKSSLIYNISYVGISSVCTLVAMLILYVPLLRIQKQFPISSKIDKTNMKSSIETKVYNMLFVIDALVIIFYAVAFPISNFNTFSLIVMGVLILFLLVLACLSISSRMKFRKEKVANYTPLRNTIIGQGKEVVLIKNGVSVYPEAQNEIEYQQPKEGPSFAKEPTENVLPNEKIKVSLVHIDQVDNKEVKVRVFKKRVSLIDVAHHVNKEK